MSSCIQGAVMKFGQIMRDEQKLCLVGAQIEMFDFFENYDGAGEHVLFLERGEIEKPSLADRLPFLQHKPRPIKDALAWTLRGRRVRAVDGEPGSASDSQSSRVLNHRVASSHRSFFCPTSM